MLKRGAIIAIFLFSFVTLSFTQTESETNPLHAPEPGSLVLMATLVFGWIARFARRRYMKFKGIFDKAFSCLGLVVAMPVILLFAALIKLTSPGPAFYKQTRIGKDREPFTIYKLRTMRIDAEKGTGPVWATENDPRLTGIGKIIRKFHFDELPQLFNVLRGEMSIVGPRPERPFFVRDLTKKITEYPKRLRIKPGITGLAQVHHKCDATIKDVRKKIKYDLLYIRKVCFLVDIRILFRTITVALLGKIPGNILE